MKRLAILIALAGAGACADARAGMSSGDCGPQLRGCPAPFDSALVDAITAVWAVELDPILPTRGPFLIGPGGDSAWTVAVYEKLKLTRPNYFASSPDSAHAPHLGGVTVEMVHDTARVTTSISQCTTRRTTYNWTESGLDHKFAHDRGRWVLLPGSLAHVAEGKC